MMRTTPKDIARALVDSMETTPAASTDDACLSAILLLKRSCPGFPPRLFLKIVEREVLRRGNASSGLLVVPNETSLRAETIAPLLAAKSGKTVSIDRAVEPELIGGAVLLVDHRRIDCSVQGALAALLRECLQPLD